MSWKQVTIQQLLSHISGIPDIVDEEESILISPYGLEESWKQVQALPMVFKPGEKFNYNQTNYLFPLKKPPPWAVVMYCWLCLNFTGWQIVNIESSRT